MDHIDNPLYFYIAHLFVKHSLTLQKVIDLAKLFTDKDPQTTITHTKINNGFLTLVIQSKNPVDRRTADLFESRVSLLDGLGLIFTQETVNINNTKGSNFPTYVYTAYFGLSFSLLSYYLGEGLWFRAKLKKILEEIDGGIYYLKILPTEMALVIESTSPFSSDDIALLQDHLNNVYLELLTSFRNF